MTRLYRAWRAARALCAPVMALLALGGGLAFELRQTGMPGPQVVASLQRPVQSGENAAARRAASASYCGAAQDTGHGGMQGHGPHCAFCVTQAFGVAPVPFLLPPAPADYLARPVAAWAAPHLPYIAAHQPRGPPLQEPAFFPLTGALL